MEIKEAKRTYRIQEMAAAVKSCHESGLTIKAWCAQHEIREHIYYYWLKKLREHSIQENNGTSASVNVQDESGYLSQEKGENQNQQSHQQRQNQSSDENQEFSDQIKLGLWEIENLRRQYQMSQIS